MLRLAPGALLERTAAGRERDPASVLRYDMGPAHPCSRRTMSCGATRWIARPRPLASGPAVAAAGAAPRGRARPHRTLRRRRLGGRHAWEGNCRSRTGAPGKAAGFRGRSATMGMAFCAVSAHGYAVHRPGAGARRQGAAQRAAPRVSEVEALRCVAAGCSPGADATATERARIGDALQVSGTSRHPARPTAYVPAVAAPGQARHQRQQAAARLFRRWPRSVSPRNPSPSSAAGYARDREMAATGPAPVCHPRASRAHCI